MIATLHWVTWSNDATTSCVCDRGVDHLPEETLLLNTQPIDLVDEPPC
jgi:hypothetical protein